VALGAIQFVTRLFSALNPLSTWAEKLFSGEHRKLFQKYLQLMQSWSLMILLLASWPLLHGIYMIMSSALLAITTTTTVKRVRNRYHACICDALFSPQMDCHGSNFESFTASSLNVCSRYTRSIHYDRTFRHYNRHNFPPLPTVYGRVCFSTVILCVLYLERSFTFLYDF
jgi:hypothetical protein